MFESLNSFSLVPRPMDSRSYSNVQNLPLDSQFLWELIELSQKFRLNSQLLHLNSRYSIPSRLINNELAQQSMTFIWCKIRNKRKLCVNKHCVKCNCLFTEHWLTDIHLIWILFYIHSKRKNCKVILETENIKSNLHWTSGK